MALQVLIVLGISFVFAAGQSQCPESFVLHGSSCYFFSRDSEGWVNALEQCDEMFKADLVRVDDDAESQYLIGMAVAKNTTYWIGANDMLTEGTWVWGNSGDKVAYNAWFPGEPNNVNFAENCAAMTQKGGWYDIPCRYPVPYICEKALSSVGSL